ncbi:MAG: carboxypeptidase regulatory-like domain-containing protein [Calditrichota bacterium]
MTGSNTIRRIAMPLFIFFTFLLASPAFGATVSGTVTDASTGDPIEAATVNAFSFSPTGDSLLFSTSTASDGTYLLDQLPAGEYFFLAEESNYRPGFNGPITLGENAVVVLDYQLFANSGGNFNNLLSGAVTDAITGDPVSFATVTIASQLGFLYTAVTDPVSGTYEFTNLAPGDYIQQVNAPGYLQFTSNAPVFIGDSTQLTGVDIALTPGQDPTASLSGLVFDSTNFIPLDSVVIEGFGFSANGDTLTFSTVSQQGFYVVPQVEAGTYDIVASKPGFESKTFSNFRVLDGPNQLDIFLSGSPRPSGNAQISGSVTDSSGNAIENASVIAESGGFSWSTSTDANGAYLINGLPDGTYDVSVFSNLFSGQTVFGVVTDENNPAVVDFVLRPTGDAILRGTVTDSATGNGVDAIVKLAATDSSLFLIAITDPSTGAYDFGAIPTGTYDVCAVQLTTGLTITFNSQELVAGVNTIDFVFGTRLPNSGFISGTVNFDSSGGPVQQALVEFITNSPIGFNYTTNTDSAGNYVANVPAGDYIVAVHYYNPNRVIPYTEYYDDVQSIANATTVSVITNATTDNINFGIPDDAGSDLDITIAGTVTDAAGIPLDNALVTVSSQFGQWHGDSTIYTATTNFQGEYQIDIQDADPFTIYVASAEKQGFKTEWWFEKEDAFAADPIFAFYDTLLQDIDFTLDTDGTNFNNSISGFVTDDLGNPLGNAFVVGSGLGSGRLAFAFSDSTGAYTLGGLENSPHIVLFSRDGHVPEFYDDAVIWEDADVVNAIGDVTGIDASLSPVSSGPAGNGMIAGTIEYINGGALSGVFVTATNSVGDVIGFDFTDAQGSYQLNGMINGDYTIQASKVTLASEAVNVQYNSGTGNTMVLDMQLSDSPVSIDPIQNEAVPTTLELSQNYPNPFNPTTTIGFALPQTSDVKLMIYNVLGQPVKELVNDNLSAGTYELTWDGTNQSGTAVSTGVYFYSLETGNNRLVRKMLFNK